MTEIFPDQFAGQNWLITPAALAVGESPPKTILDQKWLLVLSGVVVTNLQGNSNAAWLRETVTFLPGNSLSLGLGPSEGPLKYAISHYSIPTPSQDPKDYDLVFSVEEWAPFASLSAIFDQSQSINAGYAVEVWRPRHFMHAVEYPDVTQPIDRLFTGVYLEARLSHHSPRKNCLCGNWIDRGLAAPVNGVPQLRGRPA